MCHETFVAERIVNEYVTSAGRVLGVNITKELLTSCRASRNRYANDEVRRAKVSEAGTKKRKCLVDKVDDLRAKHQETSFLSTGGATIWHEFPFLQNGRRNLYFFANPPVSVLF